MGLLSQKRHWRQKLQQVLTRANLPERLDLLHLPMVDLLHLRMADLHLLHPLRILNPHLLLHVPMVDLRLLHMLNPHLLHHLPMVDLHLLLPSIILSQFTLLPIR